MATEQYVGPIASIALGANYTAASGTITLASSTGLPTVPIFRLRLDNTAKTVLKVTAVAGAVYTVTAESNDANATTSNFATPVLSPGALDQIRSDASRIMTTTAFDALTANQYKQGDRVILSDGLYEAIYNGSSWQYRCFNYVATRPPTSSWLWDNQGSSSFDNTNGYLYASCTRTAATSLRVLYRTAPAAPFTLTALLSMDVSGGGNTLSSGNSAEVGLILRDSSGKIIRWNVGYDSGWTFITQKWTTSSSGPTNYRNFVSNSNSGLIISSPIWLRITDDNTNLIFYYSIDGQHWKQFDSRSRTDHFASGPTQIGIGGYASGNDCEIALLSWNVA